MTIYHCNICGGHEATNPEFLLVPAREYLLKRNKNILEVFDELLINDNCIWICSIECLLDYSMELYIKEEKEK